MKINEANIKEIELLVLTLEGREEDAKAMLRTMGMGERRRLQEAIFSLSYWISETNTAPVGIGRLAVKKVEAKK